MRMPLRVRPLLLKFLQPCDAECSARFALVRGLFRKRAAGLALVSQGVMADAEIYAEPWGFPLEEVRVPVRLLARNERPHLLVSARGGTRGASAELRIAPRRRKPAITRCRSATSTKFSQISMPVAPARLSARAANMASCRVHCSVRSFARQPKLRGGRFHRRRDTRSAIASPILARSAL